MKHTFFIEITDTFGSEANYSWVTRHKVTASSMRGAVWKVSRDSGMSWQCAGDYGDQKIYDSASGTMCLFIEPWDDETHGQYSRINEL